MEIPQYNVIAGPAKSVLINSANTFVKNGKVITDKSNSALAYISLLVDLPIRLKAWACATHEIKMVIKAYKKCKPGRPVVGKCIPQFFIGMHTFHFRYLDFDDQ